MVSAEVFPERTGELPGKGAGVFLAGRETFCRVSGSTPPVACRGLLLTTSSFSPEREETEVISPFSGDALVVRDDSVAARDDSIEVRDDCVAIIADCAVVMDDSGVVIEDSVAVREDSEAVSVGSVKENRSVLPGGIPCNPRTPSSSKKQPINTILTSLAVIFTIAGFLVKLAECR
jgi:hypothetical protein